MQATDFPMIFRKRYVPDETVALKDDIILSCTKDLMLTKWIALKPRKDIAHGVSAYFINDGIKVSKVYDKNDTIVYWYCDIIRTLHDEEANSIVFEDLLIDVIVHENGRMQIVDVAEAADACEEGIISTDLLLQALRILDTLAAKVYTGEFSRLQAIINEAEAQSSSI